MSKSSFDPAVRAFSRVFLIEGQARPDHTPAYQSCMRAGPLSWGLGEATRIECPSDMEYGAFVDVGVVRGTIERATSSLIGQYAADLLSELLKLAKQRCAADIHVHFGKCADPRSFLDFTKAIIWEGVEIPTYSIEDLGALSSDENAKIMETVDLSIAKHYEVVQINFQERGADVATNQLVDAIVCDRRSCGDCDDYSEGCDKAFVLQGGQSGSPGTAPDVLYTSDNAKTWASDEVDAFLSSHTATGIACIGKNVVVVSTDYGGIAYKDKATILAGTLWGWNGVTTGVVAGAEPIDIWSVGVGAFVSGDSGYVYWLEDPSLGLTQLDAGVATTQTLTAIHALNDERAVAVGDSDAIVYTTDRYTWQAASPTGGGNNLTAVWMRTETEWWVGDNAGGLYYTLDSGQNWTSVTLPGVAATAINDIQFSTNHVGYVAGAAGGSGAAWRTYSAGNTWVRLPEGIGSLPGSSSAFQALAACYEEPNFLILAGYDALNDGVLLRGGAATV